MIVVLFFIYLLFRPETLLKQISNNDKMSVFIPNNVIETDNYVFQNGTKSSNKICIHIPGGSFIKSVVNVIPFENFPYPLYIIKYKTLTTNESNSLYLPTVLDELYINIQDIIKKNKNKEIILTAYSAGCYFATMLLTLNKIKPDYFIAICGYFGKKYSKNVIFNLVDLVYISNFSFPSPNPPPTTIKQFYITTKNDILLEQTVNFAKVNTHKVNIYPGDHFFLNTNNFTTKKAIQDVINFIELDEYKAPVDRYKSVFASINYQSL